MDDKNNGWTYYNAICRIGVEKVYSLDIIYEKDGNETPIVLGNSQTFPNGFTGNKIYPQEIYRIVYIKNDDDRLRFLLKIKEALHLSDEEFTVELV